MLADARAMLAILTDAPANEWLQIPHSLLAVGELERSPTASKELEFGDLDGTSPRCVLVVVFCLR